MTDLHKEFREARKFLDQGAIKPAVRQGGEVLEALLRRLYKELLPRLLPAEAAKVTTALEEIGKDKTVEDLTLGQLVALFNKARLASAGAKFLGLSLGTLDSEAMVKKWVDLRNRASHPSSEITADEAEAFLANLKILLTEAGVIKPIPKDLKIPVWWEVVRPHRDIREGRVELQRFAAKLDEVMNGRGDPEYLDPRIFFERTHLTLGLRNLLSAALRKLSGLGGDGVLHLETAFGGGKTHGLVALYHFFQARDQINGLSWVKSILDEVGVTEIPAVQVLTFVGTEADPLGPTPWGTFGKTLGRYELVQDHDERRQPPGKARLRELFGDKPTLILIDEIAEFLCKVVDPKSLAGGNREAARAYQSQVLAFIHELTEVAAELPQCLLVLTTTTSTAYGEEGERVQSDLRQIAGRMQRWLEPVGSEDIYEVIRRRLFEDLGDPEIHEAAAEEFAKLYRKQGGDFPDEAKTPKYKEKIARAYPFHPELIDVLYNQWGSFPQFHRTRGVLRLLALVVREAWEKRGPSQLIRLSDVPLGNREVRKTLLSCIGQEYESVLACDIAGGREIARFLDKKMPEELQPLWLAEGLATAIFLHSFSGAQRAERGVTRAHLKLAVLAPGIEPTAVGDTLGKLHDNLHYLHERNNRYFFSTEANLSRLVEEAKETIEEEQIREEIRKWLEKKIGRESPLEDWEPWPKAPEGVGERRDRHVLVVLPPELGYGVPKTEEFVKVLFGHAGEKIRAFPGAILVLTPDREELFGLQNKVKRMLALRDVQKRKLSELSAEDQGKLKRQIQEAESDVAEGVVRVWRHLALWAGQEDVEWIPLAVYARPGLTITSMVVEHLRSANRLSSEISADNLLKKVPVRERKPYKEVWETFLRVPGMPIVPERAIREAIKNVVRQGILGLEVEGKLYFREDVPDAYLDEAWVIPETAVPKKAEAPSKPTEEELRPRPALTVSERPKTTYWLRAKVPVERISEVYRGVIRPLLERTDKVELVIEVRAQKTEGIPKEVIEHPVRETLGQINAQILEEREE